MKSLLYTALVLAIAGLSACNNGAGTDHKLDNTDTNYSDSRRNSPVTENTITGDSSTLLDSGGKVLDSAQHRGREGRQ